MPVLRSWSRSRGGHAGLHDGYVLNMMDRPEDHRHHGPLDTGEVPDEEEVSQAEVAEGLERDPDSQQNFTEQHPDKARDTESD